MRKNLLNVLMLLSILFAASCQKEAEVATLTLSETSLEFPKSASEKAVTVTTNQEDYSFIATAEWISVDKTAKSINIKVAANIMPATRKASVAVLAGGISKTIEITQAGSDVTIVTLPDKLNVDQFGGKFSFDVDANTKDWKVTADADWIQVTAKPYKSEVLLNIKENEKREARTATLVVTGGKTKKEFVVNQDAMMFHILPYLEMGCKAADIKAFELARKSKLTGEPDGFFNPSGWTYETISKAFDMIRYLVPKDAYGSSIMFASEANKKILEDPKEMKEFAALLKANGFEPKGEGEFFNKAKSIMATLKPKAKDPYVEFKFIPTQPKPYPTFDKFPYGYTVWKSNKEAVKAWEAKNGGKFNTEKSNLKPAEGKNFFLYFDVKKDKLESRLYFVTNIKDTPEAIEETGQLYTEMTLALYEVNGEFVVTNEFKALLEKEGFKFKQQGNFIVYENAAKKLIAAFRWAKYSDMDMPVLDLRIAPSGEASSALLLMPTVSREISKVQPEKVSRMTRVTK